MIKDISLIPKYFVSRLHQSENSVNFVNLLVLCYGNLPTCKFDCSVHEVCKYSYEMQRLLLLNIGATFIQLHNKTSYYPN